MTADEYYSTKVKLILDSVVVALNQNNQRRFSQADVYFFSRWWSEQNDTMKANVIQLVKEGRLEFVLGGWVAHDEACPTYEEILINIMTGRDFLIKEFGIVPKVAWLADSFGHSAATPELLY